MKIIFFGTPEIAMETLKILSKVPQIEIMAVITQPDKKVGRKRLLTPPPIKKLAQNLNLKILQPKNSKELEKMLQPYKADFFVVFAFGMILSEKILKMPEIMAINIHTSLLPKYRGASPIQESLLKGDRETGVSIIKMNKEMDQGDILLIRRIAIEENDNYLTLSQRLAQLSSGLIPFILDDIKEGNLKPIPQNNNLASYCRKITKNDGKIDWNTTALEIHNKIRAYYVWPIAFTEIGSKKLKILESNYSLEENMLPGTFKIQGKILKIGTKEGILLPKIVQIEGKKEMDINSFINGYSKILG